VVDRRIDDLPHRTSTVRFQRMVDRRTDARSDTAR
jgi:hypothetical protein